MEEKKIVRNEKLELKPLEVTPDFELNVVLTHKEEVPVKQEFLLAVQLIGQWAQGRFQNIASDIPLVPEDYELHVAGYNLNIMGNATLGFYKLSLDHVDMTRKGVVWRTVVTLQCSERIRMKVECDYCHPPDRLVRDSFAKPRFVDEIFRKIGYEDVIPMALKPHKIHTMQDMEELSRFITNDLRTLPVVVAVEEEEEERQINIARLAETIGTYAHIYQVDKKALPMLVEMSDYTKEELMGAVWVTFRYGEVKFFTRDMIAESRFDFNKYAFDTGNVYEKAFRHQLVRLIKEKNCM